MDMKIDDEIAKNEFILSFFENIHPNYISIIGIITNFIILYYLFINNTYLANLYLVIRYFTDILDGAVARNYNKTSKIGGILDTINDGLLTSMYVSFLFYKHTNNMSYTKLSFLITLLLFVIYLKINNSISDHTEIKNYDGNDFLKKLSVFIPNNTIFIFILVGFYNYYYLY